MELPQYLNRLSASFLAKSRQLQIWYGFKLIVDEKVDSDQYEDTDFWHGAEIEQEVWDFNLHEEVGETAMSLCVYPVVNGSVETSDWHKVELEILAE